MPPWTQIPLETAATLLQKAGSEKQGFFINSKKISLFLDVTNQENCGVLQAGRREAESNRAADHSSACELRNAKKMISAL